MMILMAPVGTNAEPQKHAGAMKLRVLIADDELLCRERLRRFLQAEPGMELIAECANGAEAVEAIRQHAPDLAFLDVNLPELNAFGVIEKLSDTRLPAIVFVTAYDEFALRAFEIDAVDYLLKPFDRPRFQTALRRAQQRLQLASQDRNQLALPATTNETGRHLQRLTIKSAGRIVILKSSEIEWICAADNYVELHTADKTHLLRTTLSSLANRLPKDHFVRISRSILVNLDRIKELRSKTHGDYLVCLQNGKTLTGSRNYREGLTKLTARES